jgi:hypothetical protein
MHVIYLHVIRATNLNEICFLGGGLSLNITASDGNVINALGMKIYMLAENWTKEQENILKIYFPCPTLTC